MYRIEMGRITRPIRNPVYRGRRLRAAHTMSVAGRGSDHTPHSSEISQPATTASARVKQCARRAIPEPGCRVKASYVERGPHSLIRPKVSQHTQQWRSVLSLLLDSA